MLTTKSIQLILDEASRILIISHVGPDGDALGSLTAMGLALSRQGKQVALVCDDRLPSRFDYLPLFEQIQRAPDADVNYDLVITLDCGDEFRVGSVFANLPAPRPTLVNIDHHVTNTMFGDVNLVDEKATSTVEILYKLFAELGYELTADIALSLLTGLVTDTLGFRTVSVTSDTLKIAGDLMDAGADLSLVTAQALNQKPLSMLRLWQIGLRKMKLEDGLIWASISNEERREIGHKGSSTAGLVNLMSYVEQAAISAVLLEMEDGSVRVGFRCRPPYSVSEVALNLGGGGHSLAAGCTMEGPLTKAESLVVAMSKEAIRDQTAVPHDNGDWRSEVRD